MPPHRSQLPAAQASDPRVDARSRAAQDRQVARTNPPFLKLLVDSIFQRDVLLVPVVVGVGGIAGVVILDPPSVSAFPLEVAKRIAALNTAIGWPADASIAAADRARVRTQVAREFFRAEHGRPAERGTALVDLLVHEVLDARSVTLAAPPDGIDEPQALRRLDGSSVYTVAGADLYTSQRIVDAERRPRLGSRGASPSPPSSSA
jgi:hypothetical protein